MKRSVSSGIILALLLISMLTSVFNIGPVESEADPLLWSFNTEPGPASVVFVSPNNEYVIAGSGDTNVYSLDLATGQQIWNYSSSDVNGTMIHSVFVSPDNQYAIAGIANNVYCFNITNGNQIWNYTTGEAWSVHVSPDSQYVIAGSDSGTIFSFDIDNGTLKWSYPAYDRVYNVFVSPDGNCVLASAMDEVLALDANGNFLWNYTTNSLYVTQKSLFVSPDSRYVIAGDTGTGIVDGRGRIYALNITNGQEIWNYQVTGTPIEPYSNIPVTSVRVSYDSQHVVAGTGNGITNYLDISDGRLVWYHNAGAAVLTDVAMSPDGKYVVTGHKGTSLPPYVQPNVFLLRAADGSKVWNHSTFVYSISISPDSQTIVVGAGGFNPNVHAFGAAQAYVSLDDWPMFHHDLARSGYSSFSASDRNFTLWTYNTGIGVSSSPAVVAGKIYFGSDDTVYCLNAFTGESVWNYTRPFPSGGFYSGPAVVGDRVYVGAWDWYIYCLDVSSGELVWNYRTENDVFSSPAVADGRVYIGSWDDWIYCLDAPTGELAWRYKTGYDIQWSSAAVADGRVYVGSMDNKLYCLDASTGTQIWNYTTGKYVHSSPALVDGKVYMGSADHKVYCLDALTGAQIWNYTTDDDILSSPAVADDRVYIGSTDWNVYCLNATTGVVIWKTSTGNAVHSSPAVAGNRVYVGSDDNNVYCFDALTGALIWKYKTDGPVTSSPAIAGGQVYIGSMDGTVYAFGSFTPSFGVEDNGVTHEISVASNSRISDFSFNQSSETIRFDATGTPDTPAFANITFPTPLLDEPYTVLEDGSPITPIESINDTHTSLYIEYVNNIHTFEIIGTTIISGYPTISVDPTALDFPQNYPMDYPTLMNVTTITNVGDAALIVQSITLTLNEGATYAIDAIYREGRLGALFSMAPPFVVSPNKSAYVRVTFNPPEMDPYMGTLEIVSNDPNNTITEVSLTGDGAPPSCDYYCTGTVEWNAGDEEGNFELTIDVGGNITEHTLLTKFNVLDPSFTPIDDNQRLFVAGKLEEPRLSGQMLLEIRSVNSTEKLAVYNIIIEPYLPAANIYHVNWDGYSFDVIILSNSTISDFAFSQPEKSITFNVMVPANMSGYCNVTIPMDLLGGPYICLLDGSPVTIIEVSNSTHTSLYFTYTQDGNVEIIGATVIPEFPTTIAILLLLAVLSLALLFAYIPKKGDLREKDRETSAFVVGSNPTPGAILASFRERSVFHGYLSILRAN